MHRGAGVLDNFLAFLPDYPNAHGCPPWDPWPCDAVFDATDPSVDTCGRWGGGGLKGTLRTNVNLARFGCFQRLSGRNVSGLNRPK